MWFRIPHNAKSSRKGYSMRKHKGVLVAGAGFEPATFRL